MLAYLHEKYSQMTMRSEIRKAAVSCDPKVLNLFLNDSTSNLDYNNENNASKMVKEDGEFTKLDCYFCNLMLLNADAIVTHLTGKLHLKAFKEEYAKLMFTDNILEAMNVKIRLYCSTCDVFLYGQRPILAHLHDSEHMAKVLEKSKPTSISLQEIDDACKKRLNSVSTSKWMKHFCQICRLQMTSKLDLNMHMSGRRHIQAMRKIQGCASVKPICLEQPYSLPETDEKDVERRHEATICLSINGLKLSQQGMFTLTCELCSVTVHCLQDIQSHLAEDNHLATYELALNGEMIEDCHDEAPPNCKHPDRFRESKCRRVIHRKVKFDCHVCSTTVFGARLISEHLLVNRHSPDLNLVDNFNDDTKNYATSTKSKKNLTPPVKSATIFFNSKLKPDSTTLFTRGTSLVDPQEKYNKTDPDVVNDTNRVTENTKLLDEVFVSNIMAASGSTENSWAQSPMPEKNMPANCSHINNVNLDKSSNVFQKQDLIPQSINFMKSLKSIHGESKKSWSDFTAEKIRSNELSSVHVHLQEQQQQSSQLSTAVLQSVGDQIQTSLKCKRKRRRRKGCASNSIASFKKKVSEEETNNRLKEVITNLLSSLQLEHKKVCGLTSAVEYCSVLRCNSTSTHRLHSLIGCTPVSLRKGVSPLPHSAILDIDPSKAFENLWELFEAFSLHRIESSIGYYFSSKSFLLRAASHSSFVDNKCTDDNTSLAWLGGVVLRLLAVPLATVAAATPTEAVEELVSDNDALSRVCWRHSFPLHLMLGPAAAHIQDNIAKRAVALEKDFADDDGLSSCGQETAHVLASLLKAIIGAVYLDSKLSLETVLFVSYRLMAGHL